MSVSLNFKVSEELKTLLTEQAEAEGRSMTDHVSALIEQYPAHRQALGQVATLEGEKQRLTKALSRYRSPSFERLYGELHGRQVNQRRIETERDLLAELVASFQYDEADGGAVVASTDAPALVEAPAAAGTDPKPASFDWQRAAFHLVAAVVLVWVVAAAWRMVK